MVRTRFAPSPTGFMHVGNLRTALYAYLLARSQQGKFILRIEDTDRNRLVEGAVEVIYATLAKAGLEHDEGPDVGGDYGPYVQSERKGLYRGYAEELVKRGAAYYCFCDKEEEDAADAAAAPGGYDGRCRALSQDTVAARLAAGDPFVIRQKIDRSGSTTFVDSVYGEITIENKVLDDQILLKRDGMPTYNFANVVDDHLMAITHVVRGSEYLPSTPKYNLLYSAFGWEIPTYVHLPLIMGRNEDGSVAKLSKRHGSVSFENLISEGYLAEAIINYIALLGWSPKNDREIFSLDELKAIFSLAGLNHAPAVFDYDKLKWMNGEYLKALSPEAFAAVSLPFSGIAGTAIEPKWGLLASQLQQRVLILSEIPEKIGFFRELPEYGLDLFFNKKSKADPDSAKVILPELAAALEPVADWTVEALNAAIGSYAEAKGYKLALVMWPLRIAVAGQMVTPGGATEIMEILGRTESLRRIGIALEKLAL
ncbi:MAG: glutamate--tRNA ligase [Victivallaceae bacterium]